MHNLGNLEDFVYVLLVSCYRTCAVFIKCPKCSGYVKGTPTWQIQRKVHSMHSCNHCMSCRCPVIGHVQFLSNVLAKCSGYVKGTPTWQIQRKVHSMHSCNHYMSCRCPIAGHVQFISCVLSVQDI